MNIGFYVAGVKGAGLFRAVHAQHGVAFVCAYQVRGTLDRTLEEIAHTCRLQGYSQFGPGDVPEKYLANADLIFVAGWQYLLPHCDRRHVVFHDSLLPKYRGFAPTVTALIAGERRIGVSAIAPEVRADAGPIYAQHAIDLNYPAKIGETYERLTQTYAQCAADVISRARNGDLSGVAQREEDATYSLWRDESDMRIDWAADAQAIVRMVDALGWPYTGAKTGVGDTTLVIDEACEVPDARIEQRVIGKLFSLHDGMATVVCGRGMVQIRSARTLDGDPYEFKRLRVRLGG